RDRGSRSGARAKALIKLPGIEEAADLRDPLEARALEVVERELLASECIGQLLGTGACGPARAEPELTLDSTAVDAVVAGVRDGATRELHLATRDHRGDELGEVPDQVVLLSRSDVERPIVDGIRRRPEHGDDRS